MNNIHCAITSIPDRQEQIASFHSKYILSSPPSSSSPGSSRNSGYSSSGDYNEIDLTQPPAFSEHDREAILEKALASSNGEKIKALMEGDISEYSSSSEADLALMGHLAFWFNRDAPTMDTVFRESSLYRKKYERDDYAKRTICKAINNTKSVYQPSLKKHAEEKGEYIPNPDRYKLLSVAEYLALPTPEFLVDKTLPQKGIAAVIGYSGAGKTFVVLDMVAAISRGEDWFGRKTKKTSVVYVVAEGTLQNRIKALQGEKKVNFDEASFHLVRDPLDIFRSSDDVNDLALKIPKGALVVIDTLAQTSPGMDENSGKDMGQVIQNCKILQQEIDGLVLLVAHTGKGKGDDIRGHSSLRAALDAAIIVNRKGNERGWKVLKLKEGEDGKEESFRLQQVEVDFEGNTSCVVVQSSKSEMIWKPSKNELIAQDVLSIIIASKKQVSNTEWQSAFCARLKDQGEEIKDETAKRNFRSAKKALIDHKLVREDNGMFTLVSSITEED